MKPFSLLGALALLLALPSFAQAQTLRITGALSNFDCYNDDPTDADGFEVKIHGIHQEDVIGTWSYSAFGAPTVTNIGTTAAPDVLIHYGSATATVPPGSYTHFGVTLSSFTTAGTIQRRWLHAAAGQPPSDVLLPSHQSEIVSINGQDVVRDVIRNEANPNTGGGTIWVLPYANIVRREIGLGELMRDNPVVQTAVPMGGGQDGLTPERMDPGDTYFNDDTPGSGDTESTVYWYKVYADVITYPNGVETHAPGAQIGTVMDATVTNSNTPPAVTVADLTLPTASVNGGQDVTATVTLSSAPPAGGTIVTLAGDTAGVTIPQQVMVPAGQTTATFHVSTSPVAATVTATLSAAAGGVTKTVMLKVLPPAVNSLSLSSKSVRGGNSVKATVFLTGKAPAGGTVITLTSSSSAAPVPVHITVPAGLQKVVFTITTKHSANSVKVSITAAAGGAQQTAYLTVSR